MEKVRKSLSSLISLERAMLPPSEEVYTGSWMSLVDQVLLLAVNNSREKLTKTDLPDNLWVFACNL